MKARKMVRAMSRTRLEREAGELGIRAPSNMNMQELREAVIARTIRRAQEKP